MLIEIRKCSRCGSVTRLPVYLDTFEDYILNRKLYKRFHFCADEKGLGYEMIEAVEMENIDGEYTNNKSIS